MEAVEDSIDPEVRHSLARSLEAHGLLLSPGEQVAVRTEELHNGARVLETLIAAGLGPLSDAPPMMERRSRILAFGVAASAVLGDGGAEPRLAQGDLDALCGLLNLGISMIDHIWDSGAAGSEVLDEQLTTELMLAASEAMGATAPLQRLIDGDRIESRRARMALRVVWLFFVMLHRLFPTEQSAALRAWIGGRLARALQAERTTVGWQHSGLGREELLRAAVEKAVLPFEIIQVASRAPRSLEQGIKPEPDTRLGRQLGLAISQLDNLVDLRRDAESADLNPLLLERWEDPADFAAASPEERLQRARQSSAIASAAEAVGTELEGVLSEACAGPNCLWQRRRQRLLWHVNAWARIGSNPNGRQRATHGAEKAAAELPE